MKYFLKKFQGGIIRGIGPKVWPTPLAKRPKGLDSVILGFRSNAASIAVEAASIPKRWAAAGSGRGVSYPSPPNPKLVDTPRVLRCQLGLQ